MPVRLRNYSKIFISLCLILTFCLIEGEAQTRRKRTRRPARPAAPKPVITNPPIAPSTTPAPNSDNVAATGDVKIISTADQTTEPSDATETKKPKTATGSTQGSEDDMQQTITNLSNQVNRLNDKLTQMQDDDRYQLEMERLTRAEQRAEQLRMQLIDVQSKIADLESQLEGIEYGLRPENIERSMATFGSTRPEEARQARQRQLENERNRVKAQLRILQTSLSRLEVSSANADSEVDLLRAKLQQRRDQMEINAASGESKPKKPEQQP